MVNDKREITVVFEHCLWPNSDYWIDHHPENLDSIKAAFNGTGPTVMVRTRRGKNKEGVLEIHRGWVSLDFRAYWPSIPELVPSYVVESQRSKVEMVILCWLVHNTNMSGRDLDRPVGAQVRQSLSDYDFKVGEFHMLMHEIFLAEETLNRMEKVNSLCLDAFILKILGLHEAMQ